MVGPRATAAGLEQLEEGVGIYKNESSIRLQGLDVYYS